MSTAHKERKLQQKEYRWISQSFVVLHGASMLAAFAFVADTWGLLSISLLRWVVTTGWIHFVGVLYSLAMIHWMEEGIKAGSTPSQYHIARFVIPTFLLLAGWAIVGFALTDAAWWAESDCYYFAHEVPSCQE